MYAETQSPGAGPDTGATVEALIRAGVRLLEGRSGSPRLDTEILLAHALGCTRATLFARRTDLVTKSDADGYFAMIRSRQAGQPVAQLTGAREFWSLNLAVTPDVLAPRPETELLVERALAHLPEDAPLHVLDLGTGSGAVALALASERPACEVLATDRSLPALEVARRNAEALGLARVRFAPGDWLAAVGDSRFDVIASNPPYIADAEWSSSDPELAFEPRLALAAGADGLDAIRVIVSGARQRLRPGGWLLLEHGAGQGEAVRGLMAAASFERVATSPDLAGRPRVTEGCRPS